MRARPVDQPGDQACRDPARHGCGDAATCTSDSEEIVEAVGEDFREEQIVGVPVPVPQVIDAPAHQFPEEIVEAIQLFPQHRISERTVEQNDDLPLPQAVEKSLIRDTPQERISE